MLANPLPSCHLLPPHLSHCLVLLGRWLSMQDELPRGGPLPPASPGYQEGLAWASWAQLIAGDVSNRRKCLGASTHIHTHTDATPGPRRGIQGWQGEALEPSRDEEKGGGWRGKGGLLGRVSGWQVGD